MVRLVSTYETEMNSPTGSRPVKTFTVRPTGTYETEIALKSEDLALELEDTYADNLEVSVPSSDNCSRSGDELSEPNLGVSAYR